MVIRICFLSVLLSATATGAPKLGRAAPSLSLRDLEGTLVSLDQLAYPGKPKPRRPKRVVVLDFFRTDCKPCVKALPKLTSLQRALGPKVQFLLVALLEEEEGQEKLERFLKKHPVPFPVLVDAYAVATKRYVFENRSIQIPMLFVIDKDGVLRGRFRRMGEKEHDTLRGLLLQLSR